MEDFDEPVETREDVVESVDTNQEDGDVNAQLQDRIAGNIEDDPWYSESEGKVVTSNGKIIINPETGKPYTSLQDYEKSKSQQQITEKPKNEVSEKQPMSRSFNDIITGGEQITPEMLFDLSKVGSEYSYNDELIPTFDPNIQQESIDEIDPVQAVIDEREILIERMVNPINEIRDALLQQNADERLVDKLLYPIIAKQQKMIDDHYNKQYHKALEEKISRPVTKKEQEALEKETQAKSAENIEKLSRIYFPKDGKDAFFALIAGYNQTNEKGETKFVRGPSAEILDFATNLLNDGAQFRSKDDVVTAHRKAFNKITSDPNMAKFLFNFSHLYWIGKQAVEMNKISFNKGREAERNEQQRIQKTIKTQPSSYAPPVSSDEDEGMPEMLKMAMAGARG